MEFGNAISAKQGSSRCGSQGPVGVFVSGVTGQFSRMVVNRDARQGSSVRAHLKSTKRGTLQPVTIRGASSPEGAPGPRTRLQGDPSSGQCKAERPKSSLRAS